jgi:hypothetical protein
MCTAVGVSPETFLLLLLQRKERTVGDVSPESFLLLQLRRTRYPERPTMLTVQGLYWLEFRQCVIWRLQIMRVRWAYCLTKQTAAGALALTF